MNARVARWLTRLYPRAWRERYGAEFAQFLAERPGGLRAALASLADVGWAALRERMAPVKGEVMKGEIMAMQAGSFGVLVRKPGALVPLAMSLTATVMVLGTVALHGVPSHDTDEGAVAHLWQLLMAGQVLMLVIFAVRWLPKSPKAALGVLAVLIAGVLAAMAPVYFLHL
jgi:hypothetical protein